ncbi:Histidine kinase [Gammaproteobacteria bacterium]
MRFSALVIAALTATIFSLPTVAGEEYASAAEAEAMAAKAITHIRQVGAEKAYADFTARDPAFIDRDLYVVVYDFTGRPVAHGMNPKMVGKNLMEMKDPDGKAFVRERVDLARSQGHFWQDYKFTDPLTKKILPKSMYCERLEETAVCVGIYKR